MRIKLLIVSSFAVAALAVTGCSSAAPVGPDAATQKACALVAAAENGVNDALWQFVQDGRPSGGSASVRAANQAYPSLMDDAVAAAPAALASDVSELRRLSEIYAAAATQDSALALQLKAEAVVKKCEASGVDMQIRDASTGKIS